MTDFTSDREHAGSRNYGCDWCWQRINKGERYTYVAGSRDGDFCRSRHHLECWEAINRSPNDDLRDGWIPGDFQRGKSSEESYQ